MRSSSSSLVRYGNLSRRQSFASRLRQLVIECFERRELLAADFEPIKVLNSRTQSSVPGPFVQVGSQMFFAAGNEWGTELWKSDGTVAGTKMVKDIATGAANSYPTNLTAVGSTLYFAARTVNAGYELWKSDGSEADTVMVKDIVSGAGSGSPLQLVNVNGTLFFSAVDTALGRELWKSDGTTAGTVLVKDINAGSSGSSVYNPTNLAGTLIFSANDGVNGYELWKSDGTLAGTSMILNINPGFASSSPGNLTVSNGSVFFAAADATNGFELWRTGGTAGSTFLVRNIAAGATSSSPSSLVNVNNILYFSAADSSGNAELWKSDGTLSGTVLVKDILATGGSYPTQLTNINGTLYFQANDGAAGRELFRSDGTSAGTVLIKDINPGSSSSFIENIKPFAGGFMFVALDGSSRALYRSDGTNAGTIPLRHMNPHTPVGIGNLFLFQSLMFFQANDGINGFELWNSDGTVVGTTQFKDLNTNYYGTNPTKLDVINGKLFYTATTPEVGRELWVTDGTSAGTQLVMDINPGAFSSSIYSAANVNGILYFRADDGSSGSELWRSDGTSAGTFRVKDISPGSSGSGPSYLTNLNGSLAFVAVDATNGQELWISDGTSLGTRIVKDIQVGVGSSFISSLTNVNGTLYFSAFVAGTNSELWRSDGTSINTVMIKDINAGGGSYPNGFTFHNGRVYFRATDGALGSELWSTDGSAAGTTLLVDIAAGSASSSPTNFLSVGNQLYFSAFDNSTGAELWKTDGTPVGTVLVKDIAPGAVGSIVSVFTEVNGNIYFVANDGTSGQELWKSNGTAAGTVLVKDIGPGLFNPSIQGQLNFNGQLVFAASDGTGLRTWVSDGSTVGTVPFISTNSPSAIPTSFNSLRLADLNSKLVAVGREILQVTPNIKVDLSTSTASLNIVVRKSNNGIEVFDQTNSTQLAFLSNLAVTSTQQLSIIGSAAANETITIDYQSGGFFRLPNGLTISGGSSSGDSLSIVGTLAQQLTWQSQSTVQSATFGVQQPGTSSTGNIDGFETITTSGFLSATVNGLLQAGPPNLFFNNPGTLNLGQTTQLGGGTLSTTSLTSLGAGEVLTGSGSVQGRFNAELSSLILPTGNLSIGLASSTTGFNTRGDLIVDLHSVSLLDANEAVLGSLTSIGNGATPGSLSASSGLLVDFGNNVSGFGTINTPNVASKPFTMNGSLIGNSSGNPITLTGYVKGVGNLANVNIAGTYSPGFSPAAVTVGSMSYAPTSTTVIELGGTTAGTGFDQINHIGTAALGGTLNVQLINSFVPSVGDTFLIMTATAGFTGSFTSQILPTPPLGTGWSLLVSTNEIKLQLVDLANVLTAQLGNGTPQRSRVDQLVITFQGAVDIDSTAFAILKRGVGGGPVTSGFTTSVNGSGDTVATISFSGAFTRAGGALVDGYYQLTIDSSKVRRAGTLLNLDGDNNGLAGGNFVRGTSATDNFFAYYGDTSGDGSVGVTEFGQFRTSFGKLPADPGYNALFDFDGGGVGVVDFGQFRTRFGQSITFE